MDEATKQRIFDPYFTTKGPDEGTGLGLAVVYGIVKSLSGAMAVSSKPNQGTTFDVYFPRVKTIQTPEAEFSEALPTGHGRVLVVDDEKSIVDMVKEMLETLGYEAVPRYSSTDALEAFRARPESFDLVISDMTMPHMTGIDLAKEILMICPHTPIILCTGFSEKLDESKIEPLGIKKLLMKPVSMRDLAVALNKILARDRLLSWTTASNTLTKIITR
jgi:CheY-like chemotaxis protein